MSIAFPQSVSELTLYAFVNYDYEVTFQISNVS